MAPTLKVDWEANNGGGKSGGRSTKWNEYEGVS